MEILIIFYNCIPMLDWPANSPKPQRESMGSHEKENLRHQKHRRAEGQRNLGFPKAWFILNAYSFERMPQM